MTNYIDLPMKSLVIAPMGLVNFCPLGLRGEGKQFCALINNSVQGSATVRCGKVRMRRDRMKDLLDPFVNATCTRDRQAQHNGTPPKGKFL